MMPKKLNVITHLFHHRRVTPLQTDGGWAKTYLNPFSVLLKATTLKMATRGYTNRPIILPKATSLFNLSTTTNRYSSVDLTFLFDTFATTWKNGILKQFLKKKSAITPFWSWIPTNYLLLLLKTLGSSMGSSTWGTIDLNLHLLPNLQLSSRKTKHSHGWTAIKSPDCHWEALSPLLS